MTEPSIPTISLVQPWASLVAVGAKRIETRSWATKHRGLIGIHASKVVPAWARFAFDDPAFRGRLPQGPLPHGAVIAVAELVDVVEVNDDICGWNLDEGGRAVPTSDHGARWDIAVEGTFGDYTAGRACWLLDGVRPLLEPAPARGLPSVWKWTPAAPIEELLEAV